MNGKLLKIRLALLAAVFGFLSACSSSMEDPADTAAAPVPQQSAGTLVLQSLEVRPALQANAPQTVAIPYQATGALRMLQACLQWSPDGPYCFSFRDVPGQSRIETQVRIAEPGTYNLEAFVKYSSGGQFLDSNKVAAAVTVR